MNTKSNINRLEHNRVGQLWTPKTHIWHAPVLGQKPCCWCSLSKQNWNFNIPFSELSPTFPRKVHKASTAQLSCRHIEGSKNGDQFLQSCDNPVEYDLSLPTHSWDSDRCKHNHDRLYLGCKHCNKEVGCCEAEIENRIYSKKSRNRVWTKFKNGQHAVCRSTIRSTQLRIGMPASDLCNPMSALHEPLKVQRLLSGINARARLSSVKPTSTKLMEISQDVLKPVFGAWNQTSKLLCYTDIPL